MSERTVTVFRDKADEWRWRTTASNGEIVATSGEGYVNFEHALRMATEINGVDAAAVQVLTAD